MSSSDSPPPAARYPSTSPTVMRVPRTHGLPKRISGSITIRPWYSTIEMICRQSVFEQGPDGCYALSANAMLGQVTTPLSHHPLASDASATYTTDHSSVSQGTRRSAAVLEGTCRLGSPQPERARSRRYSPPSRESCPLVPGARTLPHPRHPRPDTRRPPETHRKRLM